VGLRESVDQEQVFVLGLAPQGAGLKVLNPELWSCVSLGVQCPSTVPKEKGEGGSWPDSGGVWEEEKMDCGLQAMAEEDEDIDFYNDETFGMGEEPQSCSIDLLMGPF
jgi:hypothetical protein